MAFKKNQKRAARRSAILFGESSEKRLRQADGGRARSPTPAGELLGQTPVTDDQTEDAQDIELGKNLSEGKRLNKS